MTSWNPLPSRAKSALAYHANKEQTAGPPLHLRFHGEHRGTDGGADLGSRPRLPETRLCFDFGQSLFVEARLVTCRAEILLEGVKKEAELAFGKSPSTPSAAFVTGSAALALIPSGISSDMMHGPPAMEGRRLHCDDRPTSLRECAQRHTASGDSTVSSEGHVVTMPPRLAVSGRNQSELEAACGELILGAGRTSHGPISRARPRSP